ncbi:FRIGIDA-like protein [Drosera capensis]
MEDTHSVANLIDSATSKIQQLQKAFAELEGCRAATLNLKWKELEAHFHGLEKSLKRRFHELDNQEKEYESKTMEARKIIENREAAVVAKEQASLERLQEKRDAAVFSIENAREKQQRVSNVEYAVAVSVVPDVAASADEKPTDSEISEESTIEDVNSPAEDGSIEVNSTDNGVSEVRSYPLENGSREVRSYPQLLKLCQNMDAAGLHNFVSDNRKNLASIRDEIPFALKAAADPAHLVLNSLDNFYYGDNTNLDAKKDAALLGLRRTCIMLMECLTILLMQLDPVSISKIIKEDVKIRAKAVADEWKPKLDTLDLDVSNGNSLEAHAFLQLLDTFSIASAFDGDELAKLIPMVSRRRQAADLCRSLGLSAKMSGVIEVLITDGRYIDAVNLAFAFDLAEQFSPIALLKSYLKEARKASSPKPGNFPPSSRGAQIDVNEQELTALKAIIRSVEEHKLENGYPLDSLQKRVLQLEKVKAEKKRATEVTKPQPKRPRANTSMTAPRPASIAVAADRAPPYATQHERYPQYVFDRPYGYPMAPADGHGNPMFGAATYGVPPPAPLSYHGNYYGNGYQYQAAYLR